MSYDSLPVEARKRIAKLLSDLRSTEAEIHELMKDHPVHLEPADTALWDRVKELQGSNADEKHNETRAAILDALPSHIALIDPEGVIVEVNESWRQFAVANALMGTNFGVGENYLEICENARGECNEEASLVAAGIRKVLKGEISSFSLDYPCHSPNEQRWFRVIATPLQKGLYHGAVVAHTNITERKIAEYALQEREGRLSAVLENFKEGLVISDINGHLLSWNRSSLEMHGFKAGEDARVQLAELTNIFELSTLDGVVLSFDEWPLPRVLRGDVLRDVELRVRRKDRPWDGIFSYSGRMMPDHSGKPLAFVTINDITERKKTEEELRTSFKEVNDLKAALDEHAIVAITDPKGKITYVNDKFCAISKFSREELIGQDHRIINSGYHPKEFIRDLWETIQLGRIWKGELKNKASDGSFYWVDTTIVPFLNDDGTPRQYVAIRADVTDRKRLEHMAQDRIVELARSNNELEQFAYVATHDLQEPLRAVASCVQLLEKRCEGILDERSLEFVSHAVDGTKRMQTLINDLLQYSRVSYDKPFTAVDCSIIMEGVLANLAIAIRESGATITHKTLPTIAGDPTQIGQLFQNLIGNALKFHGERPLDIRVDAELGSNEWLFSVKDNGIGMEEQYFQRIFRVFQRLHTQKQYRGTGIGLAICKKVVDIHGGRIWVESKLGEGSTFFFTIPHRNDLL